MSRRNTPPSEIEKLRDDVARQFFSERRAAGEGIGAFNPPSKPLGSSPITPVTGGGRGASPENSRVTSPRSASPRGAPKGPGKSVDRAGGESKGARTSRPGSPARSGEELPERVQAQMGFGYWRNCCYGVVPKNKLVYDYPTPHPLFNWFVAVVSD